MMGGGVITGVVAGAMAGSAIVAALGAAHIAPQAIRPSAVSRMKSLCRRKRMLCLTYDDGPGPDLTPRVLDALKRYDARATFFLLGVRAEYQPVLVDRAVASGHEIACHSARHLNGWKTTPARAREDVEAGYHMLERWIAPGTRFRPPYGKLSLGQYLALRKRGAPIDWWTLDSGDTSSRLPAAESIWARVQRDSGGVVLMHDMDREHEHAARAEYVLKLTDLLLTRSKEVGIRPATLSELFAGESS